MKRDLLELAARLQARHQPFVLATVVWSRSPSSGKAGGSAVIEYDGTVHGWIGGACAEPAVVQEARRVIQHGEARLMYLGPSDELDGSARDGVVTVPIACASEGALEVFMEPMLPEPLVIVAGRSPGVKTLVRLLQAIGWRTAVLDDGGEPGDWPADIEVRTSLDGWDELGVDAAAAVIVATQGHYDEPVLEAALRSPAPYVGLVASGVRAEAVLGYLRDRGFDDDALRRIDTPAGLDLGPIEHREVAVAILADLVRRRASGELRQAAAETTAESVEAPTTAVDPVCGMSVETAGARFVSEHDGRTVFFCCPACKQRFEDQPAAYA